VALVVVGSEANTGGGSLADVLVVELHHVNPNNLWCSTCKIETESAEQVCIDCGTVMSYGTNPDMPEYLDLA
jgi:hypothetical protein